MRNFRIGDIPGLLLLFTAVVLLIVSALPMDNSHPDVLVANTYYFLNKNSVLRELGMIFLLIAIVTFFINKLPVVAFISWMHGLLSVASVILVLYTTFKIAPVIQHDAGQGYNGNMQEISAGNNRGSIYAAIALAMLVFSQVLLVINLMVGLVRKFNQ